MAIRAGGATCASNSPGTSRALAACVPIPSSWSCARASGTASRSWPALRLEGARTIAMEDPCAEQHRAVAAAAGLALRPLPVDGRGARTDLLDGSDAGAVLSPAHQFPLGVVLHRDRRAAAVTWATATGGVIVEDDYDGEFRYDRQPVGALQALAPDRVAYGGTSSKTLAPGLRLAWIVVPARLLEPIVSLRSAEDVHVSALEQVALSEMLRSGAYERHVRRMRARYRARRDRVLEMLARARPCSSPWDLGRARDAAGVARGRHRARRS